MFFSEASDVIVFLPRQTKRSLAFTIRVLTWGRSFLVMPPRFVSALSRFCIKFNALLEIPFEVKFETPCPRVHTDVSKCTFDLIPWTILAPRRITRIVKLTVLLGIYVFYVLLWPHWKKSANSILYFYEKKKGDISKGIRKQYENRNEIWRQIGPIFY